MTNVMCLVYTKQVLVSMWLFFYTGHSPRWELLEYEVALACPGGDNISQDYWILTKYAHSNLSDLWITCEISLMS